MAISAIGGSPPQSNLLNLITAPDKVEGNKPDGDGDGDDGGRVSSGKQAGTALARTGSLGRQLDISA